MILESYVQALLRLIQVGKITVNDIKNAEYKAEVEARITVQ
jgi:hypothetical protein